MGGGGGGGRLCNGDVSFFPMLLVLSVKNQSKPPKRLLAGGQCLDKVMFCLKPFDFNDLSLKLTKYLMFPNSHFYVKIQASQKNQALHLHHQSATCFA